MDSSSAAPLSPAPSATSTAVAAFATSPLPATPSPRPAAPAYPYPNLDEQRRQVANDTPRTKQREMMQAMSEARIIELRDRFTDIIEGRDAESLKAWDEGYEEMWELLQERDKLADLERIHLRKIERLSDRCFVLEESRDKWRARCKKLQACLAEHGLAVD